MKGSVRYHTPARRYFVRVWWEGKDERFWRYNGEPLWAKQTADKLLGKIQTEIDVGTFDPRTYRPESPLSVVEYSKTLYFMLCSLSREMLVVAEEYRRIMLRGFSGSSRSRETCSARQCGYQILPTSTLNGMEHPPPSWVRPSGGPCQIKKHGSWLCNRLLERRPALPRTVAPRNLVSSAVLSPHIQVLRCRILKIIFIIYKC